MHRSQETHHPPLHRRRFEHRIGKIRASNRKAMQDSPRTLMGLPIFSGAQGWCSTFRWACPISPAENKTSLARSHILSPLSLACPPPLPPPHSLLSLSLLACSACHTHPASLFLSPHSQITTPSRLSLARSLRRCNRHCAAAAAAGRVGAHRRSRGLLASAGLLVEACA